MITSFKCLICLSLSTIILIIIVHTFSWQFRLFQLSNSILILCSPLISRYYVLFQYTYFYHIYIVCLLLLMLCFLYHYIIYYYIYSNSYSCVSIVCIPVYNSNYVRFQFRCCNCAVYVFISWIDCCCHGLHLYFKSPFLDHLFLAKSLCYVVIV